jgi:hypothetical protein
MAFLENSTYSTIIESIFYCTGNNGLIAVYEAPDGKLVYFINGIPTMSIEAPKKEDIKE